MNKDNKAICAICKHSEITSVPNTCACICECKLHYTIDCVDGFKRYENCSSINKNGDCEDFEKTWLRKLIDRI